MLYSDTRRKLEIVARLGLLTMNKATYQRHGFRKSFSDEMLALKGLAS